MQRHKFAKDIREKRKAWKSLMDDRIFDKIQDVDLQKTMESSYIDYAMSVIVSRALTDVRDGMKPVHRRILFAMNEMGIQHNTKHKILSCHPI